MSDLTTLAAVRAWLSVNGTGDDVLLERLITAVSAAVEARIGRTMGLTSYVETRNGTGKPVMAFRQFPVTEVASVVVDGVTIPARTSVSGTGWSADDDFCYLDGYCFTKATQNVVLTYSAGYSTIPLDLEQAVLEIVAYKYRERARIGESSKVQGHETVSYLRDVPPDCLRVIDNYKAVALAGFR